MWRKSVELGRPEIMWRNSVELGRPQITIWCMRIACWNATNTHSEHVTLIAFPFRKWLYERASKLLFA
jgi:hypothetical protein